MKNQLVSEEIMSREELKANIKGKTILFWMFLVFSLLFILLAIIDTRIVFKSYSICLSILMTLYTWLTYKSKKYDERRTKI